MKKLFLLLSMSTAAVAAAPSASSAKLVLDLPPILAGKTVLPNTCTNDEGCANSTYGPNCCNGTCQQTDCNTCTTDIDCAGNANGTNCCNGTCQATACPATCTDNTGCGGSTPNCCNGTCQATACPATCTDNTGCGGSTPNCCGGTCQATACPATCTDNTGCGGSTPNCCGGTCQQNECGTSSAIGLNDTGITWSGDRATGNGTTCSDAEQDCTYGWDKTEGSSSNDGHAGFKFTKLDSSGNVTSSSHECVRDERTGLIWEVKTSTTTTWSNAKTTADSFAACGKSSGWRLPTVKELLSIVSYNDISAGPVVDAAYFANTASSSYWTGIELASDSSNKAWVVNFVDGTTKSLAKIDPYPLRLVHE